MGPLEAQALCRGAGCAPWKATCRLGMGVTQRSSPASGLSFKYGKFPVPCGARGLDIVITVASHPWPPLPPTQGPCVTDLQFLGCMGNQYGCLERSEGLQGAGRGSLLPRYGGKGWALCITGLS